MNNIVKVENLSKHFGKKKVLDHVSFDIQSGRVIGLLGENGAGKSTLIKILADLCKPDEGTALINGKAVSSKTHGDVSYMMEVLNLFSWMRINDAINYYHDMYSDFNKEKALLICQQLNIDPKERFRILSKGNKGRVLLILAISRKVPLYLLDEPVSGLDPRMKKSIIQLILNNIEENATVLIASHLLRDLEGIYDEVFILHNNALRIINPDDIREQYHQSVEDYYLEVTEHA